MGNCIHCGKPVGWFRSVHPECKAEHDREAERQAEERRQIDSQRAAEVARLSSAARDAMREGGDLVALDLLLADAVAESRIGPPQRSEILVSAWEGAVTAFLEDGVLSDAEEAILEQAKTRFLLDEKALNRNGALDRFWKAAILRAVLSGNVPNVSLEPGFPANLQKGETPVWLFRNVKYLEDRVRREVVGRSQGVSLRVMKGVYYRVGGFKGHTVSTTERVHVDSGVLLVTTKGLYFIGPAKSLRIPYAKIVSFEPFSDGIGLMRDLATAKPQVFVLDDGWFAYNLITNLAQL